MKLFNLVILVVILVSCNKKEQKSVANIIANDESVVVEAYDLKVYDYEGLKPLLNKNDGKTYVVNFWATWCAPCVKELPYFEKLGEDYKEQNVELLLVSLDFPNQYEKKLIPFIKKKKLQSKVVALDDVDQNTWIYAINKNWSGALPATIIYNGDDRKFYEQSFTYVELENELKQFLK